MATKRKPTVTAAASSTGTTDDPSYHDFLGRVNARFLANVKQGTEPLFTTDVEGLYDAYLASFKDKAERQHHTCTCCRHFIERFGGLVTIFDSVGSTDSAIWNEDDAPDHYKPAVKAMIKLVRRAKVTGVFLSSESVWGTPQTGVWQHLSVKPSPIMKFTGHVLTAGQKMAEKREDFGIVRRALSDFNLTHLEQAVTLLKTDALYRSEKVLGQAEWLLNLQRNVSDAAISSNVVWKAVAKAPAGFCHPRSSMIGTLLEDIASGMNFDQVSKRFADKMNPLKYQRPVAPPKEGNIAAAEKIVEQLGAAGALRRRFANMDDVQVFWRPTPKKTDAPKGGVFGHLRGKTPPTRNIETASQPITWVKFAANVLPTVDHIQILVPSGSSGFITLLTAVNGDATPILQWDLPEKRNPVSWYMWAAGSNASQHSIEPGYVNVSAITLKPSMWNGGHSHQGEGAIFLIEGATETRDPGLCLFPEILKAEFHGIRSVLEAHSRSEKLEGMGEPTLTGLMVCKNTSVTVRVAVNGIISNYRIDRWD